MGVFMLSNDNILSKKTFLEDDYFETASGYLSKWFGGELLFAERYGSSHIILFICVNFIFVVLLELETKVFFCVAKLKVFSKNYKSSYDEMEAISDDFYREMTPYFLVKEYKRACDFRDYMVEHIKLNYN